MNRRFLIFVLLLLVFGCRRPDAPAIPPHATKTSDGVRWIRLRAGDGPLATRAEFWSVEWTEVPCDAEQCKWFYAGVPATPLFAPFRTSLVTMRESEIRRVWVPTDEGDYATYDLRLARLTRAGADGQPVGDSQ